MNKQNELEKNSLPVLIENNLTRISALKTLAIPPQAFKEWYNQIKNDIESGLIESVERGFKKLLTERAYGGLDYAVFLEGAKKDLSKEASEQLILCLTDKSKINERTKMILKEFGGIRYLSELTVNDIPKFRKEFLIAYQE